MLKSLIIILFFVLLISCSTNTGNKNLTPVETTLDNISSSFAVINKDSTHIVNYRVKKSRRYQDKGFSFNYENETDSFTLNLDTSNGIYSGKFGESKIVHLDFAKANYYTINGKIFKVLKLIGDRNETDGEFSLFLNPDFGLLISKSNTWRTAKVICPEKSDSSYAQLSVLLYRVQTDEDFFANPPVPALGKKITPPKFE
jgi:hypothetical protein